MAKSFRSRWYGVELDEPLGRHDGTVAGVRYFAANVDRGIFVTESKLTKIGRASIGKKFCFVSHSYCIKLLESR